MRFMARDTQLPIKVSPRETLGQRLQTLRKQQGLTQIELGEIIGATQRAMSSYERDEYEPAAHALPKLAAALCVSVDYLLGVSNNSGVKKPERRRWTQRLEQIEQLPERKQRAILQVLDMALKSAKAC
jgi:transcriptional regulator with XRE-family HTH domain